MSGRSSACCPPNSPLIGYVQVITLPVGMNSDNPLFVNVVNPVTVTIDVGTSCENPIFSQICNVPGSPIEVSSRGIYSNNASAPGTYHEQVLTAIATDVNPSWTEGNEVVLSVDLDGNLRTLATVTFDQGASCLDPLFTNVCNVVDVAFTGLLLAQGSTTFGQEGPLMQGAVTTAPPSYTTAQTSPLSLTTSGMLRVDASGQVVPVFLGAGTVLANAFAVGSIRAGAIAAGPTSFVKLEDDASANLDAGVPALAVRKATPANTSGSDGDYEFIQMSAGRLWTSTLVPAIELAQGSATATQTGPLIQGAVTTAAPSYTTAQTSPLSLDTSGNLRVLATLSGGSLIIGTVDIDQATPGTTNGVSLAYLGANTVATGNGASSTGVLRVAQVDNGTGVLASITDLNLAQGSTTAAQTGPLIQGAVTTGNPSYTTAQTSPLSLTTAGLLRVNLSGSTTSLVVLGSVQHDVNAASAIPLLIGGYASAAAPADVSADLDAVRAWYLRNGAAATVLTAAGALIGGDATNGLDVDVTRMSALVAGTAIIGKVGIDQTTPGTTNLVSAAQSGTWSVTANAGTNLNTSLLALESTQVKLTLAQGSTTSGQTGALIFGAVTTAAPSYTTAQSSPLSLDTAGNLRVTGTVTIAANQSVNVAQIAGTTTSVNNGAVDNGTQRVTIANNSTGVLATVSTVTAITGGSTAHDAAAAAINPLLMGGYASAAAPTDVSADNDAVRSWHLRNGAQACVLTAAGALIGGDATNGLDVDVTRMSALVASSAIIGNVRIDQTTPGTTNGVNVTSWGATAQNVGTDNGVSSSGVLRVTLANNSTGVIASVTNLNLTQGSTIAGQTGPLIQGSVTTAAPSYTTATVSPLSLDTAGNLRVSASLAAGSVLASVTALNLAQGSTTAAQTGPLMQGAVTTAAPSYTTAQTSPLSLDTSGNLRVTGAITIGANQSVNLTQILGVAPDVNNGTVSAGTLRVTIASNGTGVLASITGLNLAQGSGTSGKTGPLIQGSVTTAAPTYLDAEVSPLSLTTAGDLRTTVSAVTGGSTAHDAAAAAINPLLVGGYASAAAPTAVSADNDAVRAWYLRNGAQATVLTAAGALIGGDATNGLDVDITRMSALVAGSAIIGNVRIDQTTVGTTNAVSLAQLGATTVATDNGASSAGTLRVTIANNSTGVLATVSTVTNLAQMNGAALLMGNGTTGTGSQRVTIASDNTPFTVNTKTALTASGPSGATFSTTSSQLIASNANRKGCYIYCVTAGVVVSLGFSGNTAVINNGVSINNIVPFKMDEYTFTTGQINAVASAPGTVISFQEWT